MDALANAVQAQLAAHYGTVVIPTRPRRPRDKAAVEVGVQVVERWVLAVLRHRTFFDLAELNAAIAVRVQWLNERPFRKRDGSRRILFETLDKPALKPLPPTAYVFAEWKQPKVNIDYHVELDGNYYSVPYVLVGLRLDARLTATTVEIFHKGRRVASHRRVYGRGHHVTLDIHMPKAHQRYVNRMPSRLIDDAGEVGPNLAKLVETILQRRPHWEQGYRSCLGILRLCRDYPPERMEAAAVRALAFRLYSYRSLKSILERGLDREGVPAAQETTAALPAHPNVRGAAYYAD